MAGHPVSESGPVLRRGPQGVPRPRPAQPEPADLVRCVCATRHAGWYVHCDGFDHQQSRHRNRAGDADRLELHPAREANPGECHRLRRVRGHARARSTLPLRLRLTTRILPEFTGPYLAAYIRNRIGIDYDSQDGTDSAFSSWIHPPTFDWTRFDATVGAALDGTLPGANGNQLRNISLPDIDPAGTSDFWSDTEKKQIWSAFADHFTTHGWLDRLVDYPGMADEPDATMFPDIQAHANLLHQANAALRLISTTAIKLPNDATPDNIYDQIDSPLIGFLNVWVPIVEFFAREESAGRARRPTARCRAPDYDSRVAAGDQVWQYQSCNSHECGSIGNDCVLNYPTYMVDAPALHNRIFEWMSWHERVTGELYFESNFAYQAHVTPYQTIYYFGGNGDGTLFYPGTPSRIGGTHHIPIESLRLKQIRDGMEDFEFMAMLRSLGQQAFADAQVNAIVTNVYTFNQDPAALLTAREAMGDLLSSLAP